MVDFKKLRKMSTDSFGNLKKDIEKLNQSSFQSDKEDYWYPTVDKDGNASAIIRFVPSPDWFESDGEEENTLFVRLWNHSFQGPTGKWYIENSLTTLGQDDPVSTHNSALWNTGIEANKEIVRKQKRKLTYIANILIIKDTANPENNGRVKKYKFGTKIFKKHEDAMNPDEALGDEPINPYGIFEDGANFKLIVRKVDGYTNYDKSGFADKSALTEEQIQNVADNGFSLKNLIAPENFKTYEELEKRMNAVLDIKTTPTRAARNEDAAEAEPEFKAESSAWDASAGEGDSDLDYFKKLAED